MENCEQQTAVRRGIILNNDFWCTNLTVSHRQLEIQKPCSRRGKIKNSFSAFSSKKDKLPRHLLKIGIPTGLTEHSFISWRVYIHSKRAAPAALMTGTRTGAEAVTRAV